MNFVLVRENSANLYPSEVIVDLLRLVAYVVSKALWFIRYNGLDNIPRNSSPGFLIAANHQTYVDPVWVVLPLRRKFRFMAIEKAFEWRFLGPLIRYLGAFPVSTGTRGHAKVVRDAIRSLRDGAVLTIFPEGAREFGDGRSLEFKPGAVMIALAANTPILPVTIRGGHRIWPQKQKWPRIFRGVQVSYHPMLEITNIPELSFDENLAHWTGELRRIITGESQTI